MARTNTSKKPEHDRRQSWTLFPVLAWLTAVVCAGLAWLTPRPPSDLFLAIAGGEDVLAGGLGAPDTWSFATDGRVWIHQNWLADTLIYLAHRMGGETGLLLLKALLIVGIMAAIIWASRTRGARFPVALFTAGAALMAWPQALLLRANLFSLILAPLLLGLLYTSRRRPHLIWLAAVLVTVWANTHGGFMFGLAMMVGWALAHLAAAAANRETGDAWKRGGILAAAAAAAVIAAGLANPFGLQNLTVPFLVRTSDVWRTLTEWQPVFSDNLLRTETPWLFFGLLIALGLGAVVNRRGGGRGRGESNRAQEEVAGWAVSFFELGLSAVLIVMALQAQRFLLFASVLIAPLVAYQLRGLLRPARVPVAGLVATALVLVAVGVQSAWVLPHYSTNNPARPAESLFGRMTFLGTHFPVGASAFLNANGIGGRVYNEWRWEGFLRGRSPQLELMAGGRAHQAYTEDTVREYYGLLDDPHPAARLAALDVHLVVVPLDADFGPFCLNLLQNTESPWAYLYCDLMSAIFVDVDGPGSRDLLARALDGELDYGDEATAALSRALCLTSPGVDRPPREAVDALDRALALRPTRFAYSPLYDRARAAGIADGDLIELLETHADRLAGLPTDGPGGADLLLCRMTVAQILGSLYKPERDRVKLLLNRTRSGTADQELREIIRKYRFTTRIR